MTLDYPVNACVESAPDRDYPATGKRRLIMMYLRECPKCNGDLNAEEDIHGKYVSCMQCGYLKDVSSEDSHTLAGKTFVIDAPKAAKKRQKKVRQAA